jgi:DNA-binding beta-propeller fold protein YncE
MKNRKWRSIAHVTLGALGICLLSWIAAPPSAQASKASAGKAPIFQVDPAWPKIPSKWILGEVTSVAVDAKDRIWVLHRPRTVRPAQKSMAAPAVVVFDAAGNFIKAWGGPGDGYEWPATEHGIFVDYKGFVWIGGSAKGDAQVLKFTEDGKFVMQIGHSGQSKGNKDTTNLNQPADLFVYPKTNELFVADGYGNRRVIVFDADSGAFKRMWGAFGKEATDPAPEEAKTAHEPPADDPADGPGPSQFVLVHSARVSDDGMVYVADKGGRRVQIFTLDGKYQKQVFIGRSCRAPECGNGATAASTAFSLDPQQRFMYVADRSEGHVVVVDRKSLEILYSFGKRGMEPGNFNIIHEIATDSKGNLYTTEVNDNFGAGECCRRVQKFVYKGISAPPPD